MNRILTLALLLALTPALLALGQGAPLPTNADRLLREALEAQVEALNAEDADRVMALFHPEARGRDQTRQGLVAMFRSQDTRYVLESFHFVAVDGHYAYARTLQASGSAQGGPSQRSEQLCVFRRHGSAWRFWTSVILDSPPLPKPR